MSDEKFSIDHQFNLYLKRMKLDKAKMSHVQLQETRRAFYGGFSQLLVIIQDLATIPEEQAVNALDDMWNESGAFWINETKTLN